MFTHHIIIYPVHIFTHRFAAENIFKKRLVEQPSMNLRKIEMALFMIQYVVILNAPPR